MNESEGPDPFDDLVTEHLRRLESCVDSASLLERIEADRRLLAVGPGTPLHRVRPLRRLALGSLMAAVVLIAFLGGRYFDANSAQAASLLKDVRSVHTQSIDRCYLVQHAVQPDLQSKPADLSSESILWTRGEYFWSDTAIGSKRLKIGRDKSGTIWLTPDPRKGIRFSAASAIPKEVETLSQIASMTVPVLVDEVLTDFDIRTDRPVAGRSVVWAQLKAGRSHAFLSAAMLEVDLERNVLVRLVLWLHKADAPNGTVTYTLVDRAAPGDASYRLESHLDADAVIEDHTFKPETKSTASGQPEA